MRNKLFTIGVPEPLFQKIKREAQRENNSIASIIRRILSQYFAEREGVRNGQ